MNFPKELKKFNHIHFIGIGGIGISALASIFYENNFHVSGSEITKSLNSKKIEKQGIKITYGPHKSTTLPKETDLVIYTSAVSENNAELSLAKKNNIKTLSYPQATGYFTNVNKTICISGTHGKSTTSSIVSTILLDASFDPSIIIGTNLKKIGGNSRVGKSDLLVLEADEYRDAFLNYNPYILVINNIEYEHPDYFKNLDQIYNSFSKLTHNIKSNGHLIVNVDNVDLKRLSPNKYVNLHTFSLKSGNFKANSIKTSSDKQQFTLKSSYKDYNNKKFSLTVPGKHNIYNSLASIATASILEIPSKELQSSLEQFGGSWRRFEYKGKFKEALIYDDYAHHPTEIKATLSAGREKYSDKNIIAIFEPHHQKRTEQLFNEFITSFDDADTIIITDIYKVPGRIEQVTKSAQDLATDIDKKYPKKEVIYLKTNKKILSYLKSANLSNSIIFTLGAGPITKLSDKLTELKKS